MLYATLGGLWADVRTEFGQFVIHFATTMVVALPLATSLVVYAGLGLLPERRPEVDALVVSLDTDPDDVIARRAPLSAERWNTVPQHRTANSLENPHAEHHRRAPVRPHPRPA